MGINYSAELAAVKNAPAQYFIQGKAAPGQLAVFGSEPGESDYNPLWEELIVTWKAGVKPVLLVRDDQIKGLAKQHKLTMRDVHIVLNAPVLKDREIGIAAVDTNLLAVGESLTQTRRAHR
jgi:hypothetical protein